MKTIRPRQIPDANNSKMKDAGARLSHIDDRGQARMVDVSEKASTSRRAVAESYIRLSSKTMSLIGKQKLPKGNAIEAARLAGILAAKRTSELIPLCHPLPLTHVDVQAQLMKTGVRFTSAVSCSGPTGVEMEALTAVSVAALTLYDMVKAVEKGATIYKIRLLEKTGGKSGAFHRRGAGRETKLKIQAAKRRPDNSRG
jgi:cyclic pyranopterin monophosphate synthase